MRAVLVREPGGPDVLDLVGTEAPTPGPDEVQVAVRLAGVNFADINARRGVYGAGASGPHGLGKEIFGHVTAVGERVDRHTVGSRVAGFSASPAYAEVAVAHQDLVWAVPDGVRDEQAAAFPTVGHTAFHLLASSARLVPGESVLVTAAAGGVGSAVIQVARLLGAGLVVGAAGSAERASAALALGADAAVDYSTTDLAGGLRAASGKPVVDIVLDGVGGPLRRSALRCLAPFGRLVHFGNSSGEPEELPTPRELREREAGVLGFHLQPLRDHHHDLLAHSADVLLGWLRESRLRIPVAEVLPLARAAEAHRKLESRQVLGKLLLSVGPAEPEPGRGDAVGHGT